MKKSDVLKQIIDLLYASDNPEGEAGEYTLDDFLGYVNSRYTGEKLLLQELSGDRGSGLESSRKKADDISSMLVMMYRYAKSYIRKALKNSNLQTADEFSFLITLMSFNSLTKSELINRQVMEKTSGTEVIRRLVRAGLVNEFSDESDRRTVRVAITNAGKKEINSILPAMGMVSDIVKGNLTPGEVNTLAFLLRKLDYFHHDVYQNSRTASLEEIRSKVEM
jgi:DNA-binding MarR family transcriptional regulator